jgi:hypothetical protein
MKRIFMGLFLAALALTACSSGTPTKSVNGELSANTRAIPETAARRGTSTTRRPRSTATTRRTPRTTRTTPTTPTIPQPTVPATPTTMSQSGVAGVVLYETGCAADRPCSFTPGPAQLQLRNGNGNVVATGRASDHGSFVIPVAPGNYTLLATPPSKKQRCAPVGVTVTAGQYATTRVDCGAK